MPDTSPTDREVGSCVSLSLKTIDRGTRQQGRTSWVMISTRSDPAIALAHAVVGRLVVCGDIVDVCGSVSEELRDKMDRRA